MLMYKEWVVHDSSSSILIGIQQKHSDVGHEIQEFDEPQADWGNGT